MPDSELVPIDAEIVQRRESDDWMPVLSIEDAIRRKQSIISFVKQLMVKDTDYGDVPGGRKPTLLKPGAEKLCSYFGLIPRYLAQSVTRDWTGKDHGGEPFFEFDYKCQLVRLNRQESIVGEGDGSCNSWETKYRYREQKRVCPTCNSASIIKGKAEYGGGWLCFKKQGGCGAKFGDKDASITGQIIGRVPNPDVFDQVNTFEKMAQKRALVAATLNAVNASEFFTQDQESATDDGGSDQEAQAVAEHKITAMKAGAQYEDVSTRDERRDAPSDHPFKPEPGFIPGEAPPDAKPVAVMPPPNPKPPFSMAKSISEFQKLHQFAVESLGKEKGDAIYYKVLGNFGAEHSNQIKSAKPARDCYRIMAAEIDAAIAYKKGSDAFDGHMQETGA